MKKLVPKPIGPKWDWKKFDLEKFYEEFKEIANILDMKDISNSKSKCWCDHYRCG